jgi:hypothetical protein
VPSLFTDLKDLYADAAKATEMGKAFAEIEKSLADSGKFPGAADKEAKAAEVRVYALNLLAYHKVGSDSHCALSQRMTFDFARRCLL